MTQRLYNAIVKWQDKTFPGSTFTSKSVHLQKELGELSEAIENDDKPAARMEMADCFILLMGMAHKLGFDHAELVSVIEEKHFINLRRKWGQPDADGVVEHVDDDTDDDNFTPCDECDRHDACADFGCAIKAGLRMCNPW